MKKQVIQIGDKVEMCKTGIQSKLEGTIKKQYVSQVLDYMDGRQIKLSMPMESGRIIPLSIGENYEVCFYTDNGLFQSVVEIKDRYKEENLYVMIGEFTADLEKCQRRQYYRLEQIIDINYRCYTKEEETLEKRLTENNFTSEEVRINCKKILDEFKNKWLMATITDISGGGVRFNSNTLHKSNALLFLRIPIEQNGECQILELKGEVVKSTTLENRRDFYETRVKFIDIDKDEREQIVKFIFAQERKMLRKGTL